MSNYEAMSIEELETAVNDITAQQRELKAEKLLIQGVLSQKVADAEAQRKLARMSTSEKEAMLQILQTEGIDSAEGFGQI